MRPRPDRVIAGGTAFVVASAADLEEERELFEGLSAADLERLDSDDDARAAAVLEVIS